MTAFRMFAVFVVVALVILLGLLMRNGLGSVLAESANGVSGSTSTLSAPGAQATETSIRAARRSLWLSRTNDRDNMEQVGPARFPNAGNERGNPTNQRRQ